MEKLELKHLAPYLPYGLTCLWGDKRKEIYTIMGVSFNRKLSVRVNWYKQTMQIFAFKPILRPLSDLTNEDIKKTDLGFLGFENLKNDIDTINVMTFQDVHFLLSNHFDVFGLIDKGLAIDINTLN